MVSVSLPDSVLGHIPESRSPLTGSFGALVTPLEEGGSPVGGCAEMSAPRSISLSALGVLQEPPAAGFPGSPHPAWWTLMGPTEQTWRVCVPLALDPALNEDCDGADRETEAGRSQERRGAGRGNGPRRRPPRSPRLEQDQDQGLGPDAQAGFLALNRLSGNCYPPAALERRQGLLSRVLVTEAVTATSRDDPVPGTQPRPLSSELQAAILPSLSSPLFPWPGATSLPVTMAWSGRHRHPIARWTHSEAIEAPWLARGLAGEGRSRSGAVPLTSTP